MSRANVFQGKIPLATDSLTYTSFGSVSTITEDPYSAIFLYDALNQRAKMEVKQSGSPILTRWYPENGHIKETAGGTTTYYNLLRDHLGSITHLVSSSEQSRNR